MTPTPSSEVHAAHAAHAASPARAAGRRRLGPPSGAGRLPEWGRRLLQRRRRRVPQWALRRGSWWTVLARRHRQLARRARRPRARDDAVCGADGGRRVQGGRAAFLPRRPLPGALVPRALSPAGRRHASRQRPDCQRRPDAHVVALWTAHCRTTRPSPRGARTAHHRDGARANLFRRRCIRVLRSGPVGAVGGQRPALRLVPRAALPDGNHGDVRVHLRRASRAHVIQAMRHVRFGADGPHARRHLAHFAACHRGRARLPGGQLRLTHAHPALPHATHALCHHRGARVGRRCRKRRRRRPPARRAAARGAPRFQGDHLQRASIAARHDV
mmetsp:Transcript_34630/g.114720  ORF Transcript_34630/g.114720 Transcript_34630/m.114720 type:complete len:329 (-) Transcript_34630:792-1778(-)